MTYVARIACQQQVFAFKKEQLLTDDEIIFIEDISERRHQKVKLTGGEPLVRPNLLSLIKRIKQISGIEK